MSNFLKGLGQLWPWLLAVFLLLVILISVLLSGIRRNPKKQPTKSHKQPATAAQSTRQPTSVWMLACLFVSVVCIILTAIGIVNHSDFTWQVALLGGLFLITTFRYFANVPRRFFPKFGMVVSGTALLIWLLFTFLPSPQAAASPNVQAPQAAASMPPTKAKPTPKPKTTQ